jgi:hypothetical protein
MSTTTAEQPARAGSGPFLTSPRVDLYAPIHKGLRLFMIDTLGRVGWLDVNDPVELAATLAQVQGLLDFCRGHLERENRFVHPALEARRPGSSLRISAEHVDHLDAIAALEGDAAALRALPGAAAVHRFYRHLALFIAENFEHMNLEETGHNAALWASYTDTELADIHERLMASIDEPEMALVLRWMVPAMEPAERAAMLGAMQLQMPPEAMRKVLDIVRQHLDGIAWTKLAQALGLPPTPARAGA